ncbi:MAG: class I SAM-dependent methyltransferase [Firmicutes bacterium]|nr:class I SAM-dependent methyltransferase [Bacillota bacterium]
MNHKKTTELNRAAWNEALGYHQRARNNALQEGFLRSDFTTFNRDCDDVLIKKLKSIDFVGKKIAQLPCNNGRELLSLMRFGAKAAFGFDISDVAITEARSLAEISKLNATFERVDILELDSRYDGFFDFIYISEGSLQWFPDLFAYFAVVARLLKNGGEVLIFEIHPFAYFFDYGFDFEKPDINLIPSYFDKSAHSYPDGLDYVGGVRYQAKECRWFLHKLSDIFAGLRQNDIAILSFDEYNLEMANNTSAQFLDKFPLSYILCGKRR